MKTKFIALKWGALLLGTPFLQAQNLSGSLQGRFSNAVIARVAEVAAVTGIPPERQLVLAEYYNMRDSVIAVETLTGKDKTHFKTVTDSLEHAFDDLLKVNERIKYYASVHGEYIKWEAVETAAWLRKKYHVSPELQTVIYSFMKVKNENLNKIFALKANVDISNSTQATLNENDSLLAIYRIAWKGEAWLEQKIKELEAISPLNAKESKILHDQFLYLCLKKGSDYYRNFRESLQFATGKREYFNYLYKDSIEQVASRQSDKELQDLSYKYGLPDSLVKKIRPLLSEKCRKEQEWELRMPYGPRRDSLEKDNAERTWAAIKMKLIRACYFRLSDSRYVYAMRYQRQLALSNAQLDSLATLNYRLDISNYLYSLADPWNKLDAALITGAQLEKVLRPGQYDTLLKIESRPWALTKAEKDWAELKKYNLTATYDSTAAFQDIFYYHLNCKAVERRYSQNPLLAQKIEKRLADNKPAILKRLDAAIKLNDYDSTVIR